MKLENLESAMDEMFDFITDLPSGLDGFESDFNAAFAELEKVKSDDVIKLPCKIGDTLWSYFRPSGLYLRHDAAPYQCEVVFIGINGSADFGGGFVNVVYRNGEREGMLQFNFEKFGKDVFRSRKEAIESMQWKEWSKEND